MLVGAVVQGQENVSWTKWLQISEAAEAAKLESLFSSDHYSYLIGRPGGARDTWTVLAALATQTRSLKLGSLVSPVTFRHPSLLARIAVTVGEIAGGGRIEVGIGAGWHEPEHVQHGFPFPPLAERLGLLAEQAEILRRSWSGERFDFAGRHYQLVGAEPEPTPAEPPRLILGGIAKPGTIAPAVAFADEYNTHFSSPETCRERAAAVRRACEKAGRSHLPFSLMMNCVTARTQAKLKQRCDHLLTSTGRARIDPERTIVGTVDEVVERLGVYADAGVDRILLQDLSLQTEMVEDWGEVARQAATA